MSDAPTLHDFLRRFGEWRRGHAREQLTEFQQRFCMMSAAIGSIRNAWREIDRLWGHSFNIFRVLGVETKEIRHSALITSLLDPNGCHGQGNLFLRAFLETLANCESERKARFPKTDADAGWRVSKEKRTADGHYLDVVLECEQALIIIENKVGAPDGHEQVKVYGAWLERHSRRREKEKALLYLTPEGRKSESAGDQDYFRISYHSQIRSWLKRCIGDVEAARVRDVLEQYLTTVTFLVGR
jgi:hypothetical protein